MEEAHRIGQRVLDEHALSVAGEQLGGAALAIVGEQDRRILVTQVEDKELPEGRSGQDDRLFKHPRRLELARGHIQAYAAPA